MDHQVQTYSPNPHICCCGALSWAKVIGWLQIIVSVIRSIYYIDQLNIISTSSKDDKELLKYFGKEAIVEFKKLRHQLQTLCILCIVESVLILAFAFILLIGAHKRKTGCLVGWMIVNVVGTISYVALTIVWLNILKEVEPKKISGCVIGVLIRIFGLWVVNQLKNQINTGGYMGNPNGVVFTVQDNKQVPPV